ncbi:GNAT family N-acetyltransferase [Pseudidiomarina insulisalsae]|uniref:GNAT family N-acetyltransferase n=2 Tax=Pseudidiomarina insulisalsae TaxID=575789 RepID=A0A432YMJ0_9GAMM|nr:GNAT family N-acetyltransferase [Pseudidiomarina insulisalsae]
MSSDIAALLLLERSFYPTDGYPAPFFYQALHQWPHLVRVACKDLADASPILGYCLGAPAQESDRLWLMSLLIAPECRGQGIGRELLNAWLAQVENMGYQHTLLTVAPDNLPAVQLYQRQGFVVAEKKLDYLGPGQHRLVMQRRTPKLPLT